MKFKISASVALLAAFSTFMVSCSDDVNEPDSSKFDKNKSAYQLTVEGAADGKQELTKSDSKGSLFEPVRLLSEDEMENVLTRGGSYSMGDYNGNYDAATTPTFSWDDTDPGDVIIAVNGTDSKFAKWVNASDQDAAFYTHTNVTKTSEVDKATIVTKKYLDSASQENVVATTSKAFSLFPVTTTGDYGFKFVSQTEDAIKFSCKVPSNFVNDNFTKGTGGAYTVKDLAYAYGSNEIASVPGKNNATAFTAKGIHYTAANALIQFRVANWTSSNQRISGITVVAIDKDTPNYKDLFPTEAEFTLNGSASNFSNVGYEVKSARSGFQITFNKADQENNRNLIESMGNYNTYEEREANAIKYFYASVLPMKDTNAFNNTWIYITITTYDEASKQYKQFVSRFDADNLATGGSMDSSPATGQKRFCPGKMYSMHFSMGDGTGADKVKNLYNSFTPPFAVMTQGVVSPSKTIVTDDNNTKVTKTQFKNTFLNMVYNSNGKSGANLWVQSKDITIDGKTYFVPTQHHWRSMVLMRYPKFAGASNPWNDYTYDVNIDFPKAFGGSGIPEKAIDVYQTCKPDAVYNGQTYVANNDYWYKDGVMYTVMMKRVPTTQTVDHWQTEKLLRSDKYKTAYRWKPTDDGFEISCYYMGDLCPLTLDDIAKPEFWDSTNNPFIKTFNMKNGEYWALPMQNYSESDGWNTTDKAFELTINSNGPTFGDYKKDYTFTTGDDRKIPENDAYKLILFQKK